LHELPLSAAAFMAARNGTRMIEQLRRNWGKASLSTCQALMQWVVESVTLSPVPGDRKRLQGYIVWRSDQVSPLAVVRRFDRRKL
jgi:hypothetical protein